MSIKLSRAECLAYFAILISLATLLLFMLGSPRGGLSRSGQAVSSSHQRELDAPSHPSTDGRVDELAGSSKPVGPASPETSEIGTAQPSNLDVRELDSLRLAMLSNASARLARSVSKSVVRVDIVFKSRTRGTDDLELYFGNLPKDYLGSGIVMAGDHVLTNYHVVRGAERISVVDHNGIAYRATLVGFDTLTDIALLHIPNLDLPPLDWGDSDLLTPGHFVWAIGNPYGLDQSVTMGIVSSTNRSTMLDSPFQDFLQTDASINPGNSGGPLVDAHGHLVGINTAIAGESFQGISFALPSNLAKQVHQQLQSTGEVPRGWIGVQLGQVTQAKAARAGLGTLRGAVVESLINGTDSPARDAGIQLGDICVRFEGQDVLGPLGLIRRIASCPIGRISNMTVLREAAEIDIEIRIGRRP